MPIANNNGPSFWEQKLIFHLGNHPYLIISCVTGMIPTPAPGQGSE